VIICVKQQTTYEWLVEDIQKKRIQSREGTKPLSMKLSELRERWTASMRSACARSTAVKSSSTRGVKANSAEVKQTQATSTREVQITIK
jgi:hypothetical protein